MKPKHSTPGGKKTMKTKQAELADAKTTAVHSMADELGEEVFLRLYRAYVLTAEAIFRRAKQRAAVLESEE
jgi:hypothetical protein